MSTLGFDTAAAAVVAGDKQRLAAELARDPSLVGARSADEFGATLLHFTAANGVPDALQHSPANAPAICRQLLEAGAEPDALAESYGGGRNATTLCLVASSWHPFERGVQAELIRTLVAGGAAVEGLDGDGAPLTTALVFGYTRAAEVLAELGDRELGGLGPGNLLHAAGLGRLEQVRGWFGDDGALRTGAVGRYRPVIDRPEPLNAESLLQEALHFAVTHGRGETAEFLLGRGASPNGVTLGHHASLPLVQALFVRELGAVGLLLKHGADPRRTCAKLGRSALDLARAAGAADLVERLERSST